MSNLIERLAHRVEQLQEKSDLVPKGKLVRIVGLALEVVGICAPIGTQCAIEKKHGELFYAEVVGFSESKTFLMARSNIEGLLPGALVKVVDQKNDVEVGKELLGRVIDGAGRPLDGRSSPLTKNKQPLHAASMNPLGRARISATLDVGVQAINGLLTIGQGQRVGLFAGSGVGKSVLLGMMATFTEAEVVVVGLIGERGREVKEFIEENLGKQGLSRSVVVAAPADSPPLLRWQGALRATAIAEYFREQGKKVLLLMDSVTRFAQAHREIALAVGEPPASKGYTPSVFSAISQLIERAGNSNNDKGSITALYTVLVEGDDLNDPIADCARAILDGHIVLSRSLAQRGNFPAIDISSSISRLFTQLADKEHRSAATWFRKYYSIYQQNYDLIAVGAYQKGADLQLDLAVSLIDKLESYLQQDMFSKKTLIESQKNLLSIVQSVNVHG